MNPQSPEPNWPPTPKMQAAGVSGALTVVLIWACRQFFKLEIPPEIASAITVIFAFVAGYFAPRSQPSSYAKASEDEQTVATAKPETYKPFPWTPVPEQTEQKP